MRFSPSRLSAEYDFYVNVCADVAPKPPICANKADAPAYQARTAAAGVLAAWAALP
jgi:hypothetical protein